MTRTLVAGIGNIFLGDDGFGVEVATRRAAAGPPPDGVTVAEYGIRGVHLAYELLDGYEVLVLVDALPMGEAPGTLAVIEAEPVPSPADPAAAPVVDAHSMSPAAVLTALAGLGGALRRVLVVGFQPATIEEGIGLSPPVAAAVEPAVALCTEVMAGVQAGTVEAVGEESPR